MDAKNLQQKLFNLNYKTIIFLFAIWMLFFDNNSIRNIWSVISEKHYLQNQKQYLINEIEKDKQSLKKINNSKGKEKFGRENYYLTKEHEDIYIIKYDTL